MGRFTINHNQIFDTQTPNATAIRLIQARERLSEEAQARREPGGNHHFPASPSTADPLPGEHHKHEGGHDLSVCMISPINYLGVNKRS